jgi:hypothetical protein
VRSRGVRIDGEATHLVDVARTSGYLVRPDDYLGFRAAPLKATALRSHLERAFATLLT